MAATTAAQDTPRRRGLLSFLRKRVKPPRRLKFTRAGRYFTGMTLLVGFGAINTGNNLLYLLLGMMLTLIIVSGIFSEAVIQKLRISRRVPSRLYAGRDSTFEITAHNDKDRLPSFSLQVIEQIEGLSGDARPAVYFTRLDPDSPGVASYRYVFSRRGRYTLAGFEVATRFPFELFKKSRDIDERDEVIVYPNPIDPPVLETPTTVRGGEVPVPRPGQGGEFFGLRDYRPGEDIRDVHWRSSAKRDHLVMREYEREQVRQVTIVFPNIRSEGSTHDDDEHAVGQCAGLAQTLLSQGFAVGLATYEGVLSPGNGGPQLTRVLHTLALLPLREPGQERLRMLLPRDASFIVFGTSGAVANLSLDTASEALAQLVADKAPNAASTEETSS